MPRRIVICCDGTGNEIKQNESNVLKFYRVLKESDDQIGFYDPGVGTISNSGAWARWKNKAKGVFGLATGYGLDGNVLDAYRFLLRHYEDGDQIYLLGFSRGAHTVRVLAGFINMVGLLLILELMAALERPVIVRVLYGVLMIAPCVNLFLLLAINSQATALLRGSGDSPAW